MFSRFFLIALTSSLMVACPTVLEPPADEGEQTSKPPAGNGTGEQAEDAGGGSSENVVADAGGDGSSPEWDAGALVGPGDSLDGGIAPEGAEDGGAFSLFDAGVPAGCDAGFTVQEGGDGCESLCALVACGAHAVCTLVGSEPVCSCVNGYEADGDTCVDIDECATDNGGCDDNATCANGTNPGDSPVCTCNTGYEADGDTCVDIDECATDNGGCDSNATCADGTNPGDAPMCTCNTGYEADGDTCVDIDECATDNGGCDSNATCADGANPGDAPVCTCNFGFTGDGTACSDGNILGCTGVPELSACDHFQGGQTGAGVCLAGRCRAGCSAAGDDCGESSPVCQAFGDVGVETTAYVCVEETYFASATDCPTGTHVAEQTSGTVHCVAPSMIACAGLTDLAACSYNWGNNSIFGTCYQGACLADCTVAGDDCLNSNSFCTATGAIGDGATDYVCVANDQFSAEDSCPSGTHEVDRGDGYYDCVAPSGVACIGKTDLESCSYDWGSNSISGTCFEGSCVADCTVAGDDCNNGNSICTATGIIGDGSADYVCLSSDQFSANDACPTATHEVDRGDGTYDCVAPSGLACADKLDLDACAYTWGNNSVSGTCFLGACLADCTVAGDDCNNGNSVCAATGVIGDGSTDYVCMPSNQYGADNSCPTGTHEVNRGDGYFDCVAPSAVACAGKSDLESCSYNWGDNSISGTCYQGACLEDCTVAGNDCDNGNSVCTATGNIGNGATDYVCMSDDQFSADDSCPSGTHEVDRGDGYYDCVAPSMIACVGKSDLDTCSYSWANNSISGTCYGGACVADCTLAGNDCNNGNSVCTATGTIGDGSTDFICLARDHYSSSNPCPSDTHTVDYGDGTYRCVPPSSIACVGRSENDACMITWGPNTITGNCTAGECIGF